MTASPNLIRLAETLRVLLPHESLSFDPAAEYDVDGLQPSAVVMPADQREAAAALHLAGESGAVVVPRGGGTQISLGMPPTRYDLAFDLRRLDALVEHEPADLTVTVEAGMRLAALQRLLAEQGQWLPLDPFLPAAATIGGILATNPSGPARIRYGSARDLVIGMSVALPNGDLVKSGGRVVKNVAGYDMAKLHIGALGSLGLITQASFKVAPLPPQDASIRIEGDDFAQVTTLAGLLIDARLPLLGLVLSKTIGAPVWALAVRFAGGAAAVDRSLSEARTLAAGASLKIEDADGYLSIPAGANPVAVRASVSPSDTSRMAGALAESGASVSALPGIGVLQAGWPAAPSPATLANLRQLAEASGGALVIERAPVELKPAPGVWGSPRGDFALMQRLKQQFDPQAILNTGRYLGGL